MKDKDKVEHQNHLGGFEALVEMLAVWGTFVFLLWYKNSKEQKEFKGTPQSWSKATRTIRLATDGGRDPVCSLRQ